MSPVFRHGRLRLYLLKLLDESPRHGYEVIRLLQDRFMGVYAPSPGTIYPRLARLEEEGLVTHDEVDGKKVYRITEKGREELRNRSDGPQRTRGGDHRVGPGYRPRGDRGRPGDGPQPARGTDLGGPGHAAPRRPGARPPGQPAGPRRGVASPGSGPPGTGRRPAGPGAGAAREGAGIPG